MAPELLVCVLSLMDDLNYFLNVATETTTLKRQQAWFFLMLKAGDRMLDTLWL